VESRKSVRADDVLTRRNREGHVPSEFERTQNDFEIQLVGEHRYLYPMMAVHYLQPGLPIL
jgi:hypothetical protein